MISRFIRRRLDMPAADPHRRAAHQGSPLPAPEHFEELVRPENLFDTGSDKRYYRASGNSFAAPIVAGTASLAFVEKTSSDKTTGRADASKLSNRY